MFCLHLFGMWDIMIWLQRMRQESPFLLSTVLSSVHTALSVKCIQKQDFFKMGFRLLYGLDTRWERGGKKEPVVKKDKKKSAVGVCPLLFPALCPFWKLLPVRCSILLHLCGWGYWMSVSIPVLIAFYFFTQVAVQSSTFDRRCHLASTAILL